jgi:CheY-like chemotaxis protein
LIDANQLELAILNLALNARDSMSDGGVVTLTADSLDGTGREAPVGLAAGRYVRLSVLDTGKGMDAETLARAREPFFTTKGVGKGTGLGLSMVHGLAAQSGGALELSSIVGRGVRADVWIPESVRNPLSKVVEQPKPPSSTSGYSILVVDDDLLVGMGTAAILEDLGHSVVSANSGNEALEKLDQCEIEIVLTDHAMPGMSGLELAGRIRERFPDMPVILATGYADIKSARADSLPRLAKPFSDAEIALAIASCAPRRGTG